MLLKAEHFVLVTQVKGTILSPNIWSSSYAATSLSQFSPEGRPVRKRVPLTPTYP